MGRRRRRSCWSRHSVHRRCRGRLFDRRYQGSHEHAGGPAQHGRCGPEPCKGQRSSVGGSGQGNYTSIQNAIDGSSAGDIIIVYNGSYNEDIEINKSISIIGQNKESTFIIGNNSFNLIKIKSQNVNITGFSIQNAIASGILIENTSNCSIFKNNITNNGIGITVISSENTVIFNNTISNNSNVGLNITNTQIPFYMSTNNTIFHNNFINNFINVYDEGIRDSWSYKNEGNYYDDYKGLDKNNDGIGDSTYFIKGGNSKDNYPLMMPYNGKIRLKEFYVDDTSLYKMLVIGMIVAVLFLLPIAYVWYRKTHNLK